MKNTYSKKLIFVGAGIGLAIFAMFGILHGSLIGGVIGLQISNTLFEAQVAMGMIPRIIVTLGILFSVMLAAVVCVLGASLLGYLTGLIMDVAAYLGKAAIFNVAKAQKK